MVSSETTPGRKESISNSNVELAQLDKSEILHVENAPGRPELDKIVNRKFDTHMVPWLFVLFLLSFIDRSNIGNARIDGLATELHLDDRKFSTCLAIFYVPYLLYDVPSNWVLKKLKAGLYLPGLVVAWGIISICTGFCKTYAGLLAARFFLGLAEAGLLGGMVVYLAMFYRRHQLMHRIGLFYCAAPLSGAIGGLLATGLSQIETSNYKGWPFIFFIEGALTVCVGAAAMCFLPHTPAQAPFLTDEERDWAVRRMHLDAAGASANNKVEDERFDWYWVRAAILNFETALLSLLYFAIITPIYSYSLFLPTILRSFGYSTVVTQLLSVPPNVAGALSVLAVCVLSGRTKQRGVYMLGGTVVAIAGYIMLIADRRRLVQYGGTFLVAAGIFPCSPLLLGWLANNLTPHYVQATGTGFQITIANMAAFIATFTYRSVDGPRFTTGHAINLGMMGLALVLIVVNIAYVKAENRKREQGKRDSRLEEFRGREERLGFRHPDFRYTV